MKQHAGEQSIPGLSSPFPDSASGDAQRHGPPANGRNSRRGLLQWFDREKHGEKPAISRELSPHALGLARWCSARSLLIVSAALFWWIGCEYARRLGPYSPPSGAMPKPTQGVVNNNTAAALLLPVDLDGTAVIYPEQVAELVGRDGEFRTGLALHEMARVLRVDPRRIARGASKSEIDPDAPLFKAAIGKLTEPAKARSRIMRKMDDQGLQPVAATHDEWITVVFPFTLNNLRHPNQRQKEILEAISRSARGLMRQPGAKLNAVPVPSFREGGNFAAIDFAAGYLPLEPFPDDRGMDEKPARE
jgi:hypothetical protein